MLFAQGRLARAAGRWGHLHPLCQQPPLSLGRLPWAPVSIEGAQGTSCLGSWCWEGSAARAHHPLRCDLHLAGAASGSPSVTAGETEGIELGLPLGLLCTTVTEDPEQHKIMCWEKFVCLCHMQVCPDWEQEPARTCEKTSVWCKYKPVLNSPYQVTAMQQVPSTKHNRLNS